MSIKRIGVLGAGLMGAGIAQVAAASGYEVTIVEVSDDLIKKGLSGIEKSLAKFAEKGSITAGQKDAALARLRGTTKLEEVAETDIIIEAIIENLAIKRDDLCEAGRAMQTCDHLRVEHFLALDHGNDDGDQRSTPAAFHRDAFLQPGSDDEASRSDPHDPDR